MIIEEILGNLHELPRDAYAGRHQERVVLPAPLLVKRIQRVTTDHGKELGIRLPSGSGPSDELRGRSSFTVDFIAESGPATVVHTRVSGMDPYDMSGIALAESALCLALDDNPPSAGRVTTAQAMGTALTARLERAGVRFEVVAPA